MSHHVSRILEFGSFTATVKWLLAYFFLYFLCFEIYNIVKKSYILSSELRPEIFVSKNKTARPGVQSPSVQSSRVRASRRPESTGLGKSTSEWCTFTYSVLQYLFVNVLPHQNICTCWWSRKYLMRFFI